MKENIQALRAVAAIMVVIFHAVFMMPEPPEGSLLRWVFAPWGQSGVDLFFVISGFVMVHAQATRPKGFGAFMAGRAVRILPLYWLITLVYGALMLLLPDQFRFNSFDPGKLIASLLMVNGITHGGMPVVFVGWTLEYEFLFYLLLAGAVQVLPLRWSVLPVALVFGLGSVLGVFNTASLGFVYGMLIALASLRWRELPFAWLILLIGVLAFMASIPQRELLEWRGIFWGIPSALIVLALVYLPQIRPGLLTWLGAASYSIYLVQVLAIPVAFRLIERFAGSLPFDAKAVLVTLVSVAVGCICYRVYEAPVGRWLSRRLLGRGGDKGASRPAGQGAG